MAKGKIESLKTNFGFISGSDGEKYHFYFDKIDSGTPVVGAETTFRPAEGPKGLKALSVVIHNSETAPAESQTSHNNAALPEKTKVRPYEFRKRPNRRSGEQPLKAELTNTHDRLNESCFDIAFDVEWTALTPIAANPCAEICPDSGEKQNQGYDNRWLMIDGKLALSTFTVKSAVANGFAAIMGSCYRVNDRTIKHTEAHDSGKFNYLGKWKRYRVVNRNSKPGILRQLIYTPGEHQGEVKIETVVEYYYDVKDDKVIRDLQLKQGDSCWAACDDFSDPLKKKVLSIRAKDKSKQPDEVALTYHGEYNFGMNLTLHKGELGKRHYHRFYATSGKIITGKVNLLNLKSDGEQKEHVYMGVFDRLDKTLDNTQERIACDDKFWHQDLTSLDPDVDKYIWMYYQTFKDADNKDRVAAIGKNFQFKTAFLHSDAVPSEQIACSNLHEVCPRCAMFGMTDNTENDDRPAIGFKGRFKSSVLVNNRSLRRESFKTEVPVKLAEDEYELKTVPLHKWVDENEEIARQILLPIQGQPKDSKRDVEKGYYDHKTGMIRGAKDYLHFELDLQTLLDFISRVNNYRTLKDVYGDDTPQPLKKISYNHELRNYAQVCIEGEAFSGTLGAENCTADETAALVMLLEHNEADHGFKLGLGKALGLGSITSAITGLWVRKPDDYSWMRLEKLADFLDQFPGVNDSLKNLKKIQHALNRVEGSDKRTPWYKPPGRFYYN